MSKKNEHGTLPSSHLLAYWPYPSCSPSQIHHTSKCLRSNLFARCRENPPTRDPHFRWCLLRCPARATRLNFWSRLHGYKRRDKFHLAASSSLSIPSQSELRTQWARAHPQRLPVSCSQRLQPMSLPVSASSYLFSSTSSPQITWFCCLIKTALRPVQTPFNRLNRKALVC